MSIPHPEVAKRADRARRSPSWEILLLLLVIVPMATLLVGMWLYALKFGVHLSSDHQRWGEFGDFVGGFVGTVLGAATVIALALTLWLQARTLHSTRQALAHQQQFAQEQLAAAQSMYSAAQEANTLARAAMEHSQALDRARNRPHVVFTVDFVREQRRHETNIYACVRIRNIGASSAHNVVVTTSPALRGRLGIDREPREPAILGKPYRLYAPEP